MFLEAHVLSADLGSNTMKNDGQISPLRLDFLALPKPTLIINKYYWTFPQASVSHFFFCPFCCLLGKEVKIKDLVKQQPRTFRPKATEAHKSVRCARRFGIFNAATSVDVDKWS